MSDIDGTPASAILYGPGGFDPDHPSRNILDEFVVDSGAARVRHYGTDGAVIEDRELTQAEVWFFWPRSAPPEAPTSAEDAILHVIRAGNARVNERS